MVVTGKRSLLVVFGLYVAASTAATADIGDSEPYHPPPWKVEAYLAGLRDLDASVVENMMVAIEQRQIDDVQVAAELLRMADRPKASQWLEGALSAQATSRMKDWSAWASRLDKIPLSDESMRLPVQLFKEGGEARAWVIRGAERAKGNERDSFVRAIQEAGYGGGELATVAMSELDRVKIPFEPRYYPLQATPEGRLTPPLQRAFDYFQSDRLGDNWEFAASALLQWGIRSRPLGEPARQKFRELAATIHKRNEPDAIGLAQVADYLAGMDDAKALEWIRPQFAGANDKLQRWAVGLASLLGPAAAPVHEQLMPVLQKDPATGWPMLREFLEAAVVLPTGLLEVLKNAPEQVLGNENASIGQSVAAASERIPELKECWAHWMSRPDAGAQRAVVQALGAKSTHTTAEAQAIVRLLTSDDERVSAVAKTEIYNLQPKHEPVKAELLALLQDPRASAEARDKAFDVLTSWEIDHPSVREELHRRLKSEDKDADMPWGLAIRWFGREPLLWKAYADTLEPVGPAEGDDGSGEGKMLAPLLDPAVAPGFHQELIRWTTMENSVDPFILGSLAQRTPVALPPEIILALLNDAVRARNNAGFFCSSAHLAADDTTRVLVRWLGGRNESEQPWKEITGQKTRRSLIEELAPYVAKTKLYTSVRTELAELLARLVREGKWVKEDRAFIEDLAKDCQEAGAMAQASDIARQAAPAPVREWLGKSGWTLLAHAGFWVLLLLVYPHSRPVQHLFFADNWLRKIAGLGYVDVVLRLVPAFRRQLFAPFRESLVPRAETDAFDAAAYFTESDVVTPQPQPARTRKAREVFVPLGGQHVLVAASGFGKTTLLRALMREHERPVVFLRATECAEGPLKAIQVRLQGKAQEGPFLTGLVYAGALDVFIDGLNEVGAATRERIRAFLAENFAGNFLVTTQPIADELPRNAQLHELRPLRRDQVADFLLKQWPHVEVLAQQNCVAREQYEAAARALAASLPGDEPEPGPRTAVAGLRNPLDGVLAAERLACGETPDLTRLIDQHVERMDDEYYNVHGRRFPWERFGEAVLKWREDDSAPLALADFEVETRALQQARLLLSLDGKGWRFRHDRIMEHFLVHAFLGAHAARRQELAADSRFVGVYRLLPRHLDEQAREELRRWLSDQAAAADPFLAAFRAFAQGMGEATS